MPEVLDSFTYALSAGKSGVFLNCNFGELILNTPKTLILLTKSLAKISAPAGDSWRVLRAASEAAFLNDGGVGNVLRDGETEGGEAVFEALGEYFAAMGFDDLFDDVQSEAGACFDRF